MDIFDLSAIIRLDSSQYEQGIANAEGKTNSLGGVIKNGLGAAAKVGVAAVGAASAAVGAFAATSIETGRNFDSAMSQVGATMLKSAEDMEKEIGHASTAYGEFEGNLREFAMFLGENTAFSATQAAEALNYMALAGYSTQDSMDMLPNVLSLAAAGGMDLARASDMVTDAQTAFGLEISEMPQLVNEMAKAASTGNTSVEQLGDAFLTVGGLAQELNGGFVTLADGTQAPVSGIQDMEIALVAMANAGIKGSEAGTHMRNMITKLTDPTDDGAAALESLGVSIFDTEGNMRSLSDIMSDLGGSMKELTQQERLQTITDLFNARDIASAEALLNAVEQDWDRIGESILNADKAAGDMSKIQLDNLSGDMQLFNSAMESAQLLVAKELTPAVRKFVQFGTSSIQKLSSAYKKGGLNEMMKAMSGIITEGATEIIKGIPQFVSVGTQLLGAIGTGIINAVPALGTAVTSIVQSISTGFTENLPALTEGANDIITHIGDFFTESVPGFVNKGLDFVGGLASGLVEGIPNFTSNVSNLISNALGFLGDNIPQFLDKGFDIVTNLAQGVLNNSSKIIDDLGTVLTDAINFTADTILQFLDKGFDAMSEMAQGILDNLPAITDAINSNVSDVINTIADRLGEFLDKGIEIITNIASGISDNLPEITGAIGSVISDTLTTIGDRLPEFLDKGVEAITNMASGVTDNLSEMTDAVSSVVTDTITTVMDLIPQFLDKGVEIVTNLAQGIGDNLSEATDAISNVVGDAVTTVMDKLPEFLDKGVEIIAKLASGMINTVPLIISALAGILFNLIFEIASHLPEFLQKGLEIIGKIAAGLIDAVPDLLAEIPGILSDIADKFINGHDWLSVGKGIVSGIADGIKNFGHLVVNAAKNVGNSALEKLKGLLHIGSPSKLFRDEIGENIAKGWAIGIEQGAPMVVGAISDVNDEALANIDDLGFDTNTMVRSIDNGKSDSNIGQLLGAINDLTQAIEFMDDGLQDKMVDAFGSMRFSVRNREFARMVRNVGRTV